MGDTDFDDTDRRIADLVPDAIATAGSKASILAGNDSATNTELLAGFPMRENQWQIDCATWSARLQRDYDPPSVRPAPPPSVMRALRQVSFKPSFGSLSDLRKAALRRNPTWSREYSMRLDEIAERVDVYLWHLGDNAAAGRCALRALDRISNSHRSSMRDGLLRTAIAIGSGMTSSAIETLLMRAGLAVEMRVRAGESHDQLLDWNTAWLDHLAAKKAGEPERVFAEDDGEILLETVTDPRDEGGNPTPRRQPQTLVVVPSLDHLPKASLAQRDRRDTPRAEFAGIEGKALPLAPVPNNLIEILLTLGLRYPWMTHVFDEIGQHLVYCEGAFKLPPICFAGGPGTGKTSAVIDTCRAFEIPMTVYSAAGVHDGAFAGTSRQWSTGRASVPLQAILKSGVANPVIILDEIEKGGESRHNGALADVLLSMTETTSARQIFDPYLECSVDLSAVSFIATANDPSLLSGPLRDRFRIVEIPAPGVEHVPGIVQRIVDDIRLSRGNFGGMIEDLAPDEIELLARDWKPGSMRGLRRAVETVLATRDRLATRN